MIRLAIVDDNIVFRSQMIESLQEFSWLQVVCSASNGEDLLKQLETITQLPDVVLMDLEMPVMDGVETTSVLSQNSEIKVLVLTVFDTDEKIFEAIRAGAAGYLLKDSRIDAIAQGIRDVLEGGAAMSPHIASKTLGFLRSRLEKKPLPSPADYKLSERETELLQMLVQGSSYQKIAEQLFISHGTVRKHVENIYAKLRIHSKVEAVQKAHAYKWFSSNSTS